MIVDLITDKKHETKNEVKHAADECDEMNLRFDQRSWIRIRFLVKC